MQQIKIKELIELADNVGLEVEFICTVDVEDSVNPSSNEDIKIAVVNRVVWDLSKYYEDGNNTIAVYLHANRNRIESAAIQKFWEQVEGSKED